MLFRAQVLKTEKYKLDLLFSIQAVRTKRQELWKHFKLHMQLLNKVFAHTLLKIKVPQGDFQNDFS